MDQLTAPHQGVARGESEPGGAAEARAARRPGGVSVVVPVHNALHYLRETVPAIVAAARGYGGAELIFVDNGSTDGSGEYLRSVAHDDLRVLHLERATIAAVRNHGARHASGDFLSFLDADCVVPEDYFREAVAVLARTGAVATGCEVNLPRRPHWIEATWHHLHYVGRNRFVHYLNSANFFVTRAAFDAIGGFDESLLTGEDAEIGKRIGDAGLRIYESTGVDAIHLGNPKTIRQFYRRNVWHALGMFATVGWHRFDKPTAMMAGHLLATLVGILALAAPGVPLLAGIAALLALQLVVPATTVLFRSLQTRRFGRPAASVALYWLYYWARLQAVALIVTGLDERYRK